MATLDSLQLPGISAEVDPSAAALRSSIRPLEYATRCRSRVLGHYRVFGQSSAIAPAANAVIGAFRYPDPSSFAVLVRVFATITVVTAVTAQRNDPLLLTVARGYTVTETTNASGLIGSGNAQKNRTSMGTTQASILIATAAAGLSGGTKTLDPVPMGGAGIGVALGAIGSGLSNTDLYKWDALGQHPQVFAPNEGFVLSWGATALATGTVIVGMGVEWAEVPAF